MSKPVAWKVGGRVFSQLSLAEVHSDIVYERIIPLYTHPMRNLTDEEINKLWAESHEDGIAMQQGFTTQQHYFAHLILQKASEK
jgi:hypothetical protein